MPAALLIPLTDRLSVGEASGRSMLPGCQECDAPDRTPFGGTSRWKCDRYRTKPRNQNKKTITALKKVLAMLVMLGTGPGTAWAGINEWTSVGPDGGLVQALAVDPQDSGTVYASTLFNVFKSTDRAVSWTKTGFTRHANALVIDPQDSGTVYARHPPVSPRAWMQE